MSPGSSDIEVSQTPSETWSADDAETLYDTTLDQSAGSTDHVSPTMPVIDFRHPYIWTPNRSVLKGGQGLRCIKQNIWYTGDETFIRCTVKMEVKLLAEGSNVMGYLTFSVLGGPRAEGPSLKSRMSFGPKGNLNDPRGESIIKVTTFQNDLPSPDLTAEKPLAEADLEPLEWPWKLAVDLARGLLARTSIQDLAHVLLNAPLLDSDSRAFKDQLFAQLEDMYEQGVELQKDKGVLKQSIFSRVFTSLRSSRSSG